MSTLRWFVPLGCRGPARGLVFGIYLAYEADGVEDYGASDIALCQGLRASAESGFTISDETSTASKSEPRT